MAPERSFLYRLHLTYVVWSFRSKNPEILSTLNIPWALMSCLLDMKAYYYYFFKIYFTRSRQSFHRRAIYIFVSQLTFEVIFPPWCIFFSHQNPPFIHSRSVKLSKPLLSTSQKVSHLVSTDSGHREASLSACWIIHLHSLRPTVLLVLVRSNLVCIFIKLKAQKRCD